MLVSTPELSNINIPLKVVLSADQIKSNFKALY